MSDEENKILSNIEDNIKKVEIDKSDLEILYQFYIEEKNSPLESLRIKDVIETSDLPFSYYTFVTRIQKKLMSLGYVKEGIKDGNAKCFYITELGIQYVKDTILKTENVYKYEEVNDNE